jgi:hypothetical protein
MKTNVLVQYRGGSYDGCFWEWNYLFIDGEGVFHDIFSSGRDGVHTQEDAKTVIEDGGCYLYDVNSDDSMREFAKESNPVHVVGCVVWLIEHGYGEHAAVYCDKCGGSVYYLESLLSVSPDNPSYGGWRGEGGIVYAPHEVYCEECAGEGE